jgi:prophage regulatory protein
MRFPEVRERVGLSRTSIWRLERAGIFPKRRRLSSNAVFWIESEIEEWLRSRDEVL